MKKMKKIVVILALVSIASISYAIMDRGRTGVAMGVRRNVMGRPVAGAAVASRYTNGRSMQGRAYFQRTHRPVSRASAEEMVAGTAGGEIRPVSGITATEGTVAGTAGGEIIRP